MRVAELTEQLTLRVTPADRRRVEDLAARTPGAKPFSLARAALLEGLAALEGRAHDQNEGSIDR